MRNLHAFFATTVFLCLAGTLSFAQTRYVVTNDDIAFPLPNGVSFYSEGANGALTFQAQVNTHSWGIGGGFFGANRVLSVSDGQQPCVYISQARSGSIAGVEVNTMALGGVTSGSFSDTGQSNGIGLVAQSGYVYASFTDSNTIGTFSIQGGCSLTFINDTAVSGLNGGFINAMATKGTMMIVTYTDGSIESFDISNGVPVSNGDSQFSTATLKTNDATYPNEIQITADRHYAIFGDTSTAVILEVSDISSGKLTPTKVYGSKNGISSSNILLSPDEKVLYVVDTQGDAVTAFAFEKNSGRLRYGCTSTPIRGQSSSWSYLVHAALVSDSGNGGGVYVAEFGGTSGIALIHLNVANGACALQEDVASPFLDPNSSGLLSIGVATSQ
jgi:Lactonase, 7-bladed beta-propeller